VGADRAAGLGGRVRGCARAGLRGGLRLDDEYEYEGQPEPWTDVSREEWERMQATFAALAPLADAFSEFAAEGFPDVDDGSYGAFLNDRVRRQVHEQLAPYNELMAEQAEREANEQAREEAEIAQQEEAQRRSTRAEIDRGLIEQLRSRGEKKGLSNVDIAAARQIMAEGYEQIYTTLKAGGATDAEIDEAIRNYDGIGFLMDTAIDELKNKSISEYALRHV
jgi:hypothetical protein